MKIVIEHNNLQNFQLCIVHILKSINLARNNLHQLFIQNSLERNLILKNI